tara:strand:+ start:2096 stop:2905 length:810 start_codon:yes stop_codon:yes gene_type:complete
MIIFKSINKLVKEVNFKADIGFVPTMGSLHKGHISLIKASQKKCKRTIVSIFVNPSQFNKLDDYKRYPRNLKKDLSILKKLKIDYVLVPPKKDVFKNKKMMKIKINSKYKILCAKFRPGHFEGVLGVINQYLKKIKAKYIFLGEKDFQQVFLIKNFIKKRFKTKVFVCRTIRQPNYLPFSSRNILLKPSQITMASNVSKLVKKFKLLIKKDLKNKDKIYNITKNLNKTNIKIEYLEIKNKKNLSNKFNKNNFKIFVAYFVNGVRLIDNF